MFQLIMFAIIGAELSLGPWYWIAYGCYTTVIIINAVAQAFKD